MVTIVDYRIGDRKRNKFQWLKEGGIANARGKMN